MNRASHWLHALIAFAILMGIFFVGSCDSGNSSGPNPAPNPMLAALVSCSECLDQSMSASNSDECFEYIYESGGVLTILHHNAAFNCCPDSIYADIEIDDGQTITFHEHEGLSMPCHCLCLYDIEYRIENVAPGTYTLIFDDSYVNDGDSMLSGSINLVSNPSASHCHERGYYPWPEPVTGSLIDVSDCQFSAAAHVPQICVHFNYDGFSILELSHINAWFNCCVDSISVAFTIGDDSIMIGEMEWLNNGGCDCICPVNVDMQIENLPSGVYTLVIGPAAADPSTWLSLVLDLRHEVNYTYCFEE